MAKADQIPSELTLIPPRHKLGRRGHVAFIPLLSGGLMTLVRQANGAPQ
jgi:hypothetical protein